MNTVLQNITNRIKINPGLSAHDLNISINEQYIALERKALDSNIREDDLIEDYVRRTGDMRYGNPGIIQDQYNQKNQLSYQKEYQDIMKYVEDNKEAFMIGAGFIVVYLLVKK